MDEIVRKLSPMNLDHLRYFVEAARHEHIGQAARILSVSPSAVSHAISALERLFDVELFQKNGRRVVLTLHGQRLRSRAEELLTLAAQVQEEVAAPNREFPEHLRIGGTHGLLLRSLTRLCLSIMARKPELSCEISGRRSADVLAAAAAGEIEMGVCFSPLSHPNVQTTLIGRMPLVLCFRKGHPFIQLLQSQRNPKSWQGLNTLPCIAAKAQHGIENCEHHPALTEHGIIPHVQLVFDSYEAMSEAVASSEGWSLVPLCIAHESDALDFILPGWDATADVVCVWPKVRKLSRTLEELCVLLRDSLNLQGIH
ncbi:MAG TPA: LysR family transcriptional regulator [Oligoflexus sp.]|nr:LysR family transcriptional regulator [Oligoflexus sp.]